MSDGFDGLNPVLQHHIVNSLAWPGLRPLQEAAVAPLVSGSDALLLAPTAGGKTEAALFPLLTRMHAERWDGISLLYVTPLRALLNNLQPRVEAYARWLGRTVAIRHADTTAGQRKRLLWQRPDIVLTTPESLEALLISTKVTPEETFADVQALIVDEVHAFAGDDRGWHLQGVVPVFTAPPQFQIRHGRTEIGQVDPLVLTRKVDGPRLITLGGRAAGDVHRLASTHRVCRALRRRG